MPTKPTPKPTPLPTGEPTAKPTPNPTPDTPQLGRPRPVGLVPAQAVSIVDDGPFALPLGTDFATIPVLDNDVGDGLTVRSIVSDAGNGSCNIDLSLEAVIYTPDAGYEGSDSCSYEACDGDDNCGTALILLRVGEGGPSASEDTPSNPSADAPSNPSASADTPSNPSESADTPFPSLSPVANPAAGTEQTLSPTREVVRSTPFPTESEPTASTPSPTPPPVGYDDYLGDSKNYGYGYSGNKQKKEGYGYGGNKHGEDWYPGYGRDHWVGHWAVKSGKSKGGKAKSAKSKAWGKSGKAKGKAGGYWHTDDAWSWMPGTATYGDAYSKEPAWSAPKKPVQWSPPKHKPVNYGGSDSWLAYDGDSKTAKAESTWEGAHAYANLQAWYGDGYYYDSKAVKGDKGPGWSAPQAPNLQAWYGDDYYYDSKAVKGDKGPGWSAPHAPNLQAWHGDDYYYDSKAVKGDKGPGGAWGGPPPYHGFRAVGDDNVVSAKGGKRQRTRARRQ